MSRFNFTLKHVLEVKMGKADSLSRRPNWKVGVEKDNEDQVFIQDHWIHNLSEVVIEESEVDILEKIKKARGKDKEVVRVVEEMKKAGVGVLKGDKWQVEGELVLKEGKIYMLKEEELRVKIIWLHHNVPAAEYGERWKMTELVTRNYWWPGVTKDIGKYMDGCDMCQRMKNRMEALAGKLMANKVLEKAWTHLTVDFITKLPLVVEKNAILVVCNRLSKMIHFVATTEEIMVEELARLFRDNVWKLHRLPESVISDRGLQFIAELTKELNKMLGIEMRLSMVFHPQIDGQTEQINQELEQYL